MGKLTDLMSQRPVFLHESLGLDIEMAECRGIGEIEDVGELTLYLYSDRDRNPAGKIG